MTSKEYIMSLTANLQPKLRYDDKEEFSTWQKRAKEKLEELLGLPLVKPKEDKFTAKEPVIKDDLLYMHFTFQSEEGYEVPCCLVKKADLKEKAPLVICLQGHSTGMHISLGEEKYARDRESIRTGRAFALDAAKEGAVAIAIEQRYMGIQGYKDMRGRPACIAASEDMDANQAIPALLIGRTAIGERVWDISRTIDVALKYFADMIDETKIVCMGHSGGGTATFYAACMEERIHLAVPSCGVCTFEDSIMAVNHCICNYVPNIRKYFDMGDLGGLIAPRKLLVVCGDKDRIFPLEGVEKTVEIIQKVYAHAGVEERCKLLVGDGGHQPFPKQAWPLIHEYID